jgi:processive rubber oxygenase RoxA-like protein
MQPTFTRRRCSIALAALFAVSAAGSAGERSFLPSMLPYANPTGFAATFSASGKIDLTGPFFQTLGTNGRACVSCHQPSAGWTITPANVQARFDATSGTDPIFRTVDGSNSPNADVSTIEARRAAYSMLLSKGLIRVGIGVPQGPEVEFELVAVDDPYGYASATELSLFRRPLPSTNLKFLSTVMWDGRETFKDPESHDCIVGTTSCFATLHFDLSDQSNSATQGHAQAPQPLTSEEREAIVGFEMNLFTAQVQDADAGELTARHASGGPTSLAQQPFYFGINDVVFGDYRTAVPFNPVVFALYDAWNTPESNGLADGDPYSVVEARRAVARGETLFNTKSITIAGVKGLNDDLNLPPFQGTCTTCHDTPNAGDHSVPAPLDIGLTDVSRRTPDLPLYTLRNKSSGQTVQTTDPGRALLTGRWKDIGRFKGPILRGLAARAPYFHNGSAASLFDVLDFYDQRFGIGFTDEEKSDLIAFLKTL